MGDLAPQPFAPSTPEHCPYAPAFLEDWYRRYYFNCRYDISGSGVQEYTLGELCEVAGLHLDGLDGLLLRDAETRGTRSLRLAIARRWGVGDPDQVTVTSGSTEAILIGLHSLLCDGDEIVVLSPAYFSLRSIAVSKRCRVREWRLQPQDDFQPDLQALREQVNGRAKAIIVNFPHNPTGATLSAAGQAELISIAREAGAWLVWDGASSELAYDAPPLPLPNLTYERSVAFGTLSKCFGLPGLRVGWIVHPASLGERFCHWRDYTCLYVSPLLDALAEAAIRNADRLAAPRHAQARANRELLRQWLRRHAGLCAGGSPGAGVTAFPRLLVDNVTQLCRHLAEEHSVLIAPGEAFDCPSHVRIGYGGEGESFRHALSVLGEILRKTLPADSTAAAS